MPRELSVEFDLIRYKSGWIGGGSRYKNVYGGGVEESEQGCQ